jgi:hypothetical protein
LLIKIWNKRRPRMETCGAPGKIESGEENFLYIQAEEDLFSVLINKLHGTLPKS